MVSRDELKTMERPVIDCNCTRELRSARHFPVDKRTGHVMKFGMLRVQQVLDKIEASEGGSHLESPRYIKGRHGRDILDNVELMASQAEEILKKYQIWQVTSIGVKLNSAYMEGELSLTYMPSSERAIISSLGNNHELPSTFYGETQRADGKDNYVSEALVNNVRVVWSSRRRCVKRCRDGRMVTTRQARCPMGAAMEPLLTPTALDDMSKTALWEYLPNIVESPEGSITQLFEEKSSVWNKLVRWTHHIKTHLRQSNDNVCLANCKCVALDWLIC